MVLESSQKVGHVHPLYAVAIHHCIAGGVVSEMKKLLQQAEQHLKDHGDVRAALELLKLEITKLEAKK
jgi:hypothetical protein